jgi:hypothetical protein
MSFDIWGWIEIALAVFHCYVTFMHFVTEPRRRSRQRFRSLKFWGFEWTAYDRDDDCQS